MSPLSSNQSHQCTRYGLQHVRCRDKIVQNAATYIYIMHVYVYMGRRSKRCSLTQSELRMVKSKDLHELMINKEIAVSNEYGGKGEPDLPGEIFFSC